MSSVRPHRKAIYTSNQTNGKGGSSTHTPTTHRTRRLSSKRSARGRLRSAFIQPVASSRRWWSWWWCGRFGFGGGARGARGRTRTRTRQRTRGRRSLPHAARARAGATGAGAGAATAAATGRSPDPSPRYSQQRRKPCPPTRNGSRTCWHRTRRMRPVCRAERSLKEGVCDMRGEVWVGRHAGVYAAAAAEAAHEAARKSRGAGPSEG